VPFGPYRPQAPTVAPIRLTAVGQSSAAIQSEARTGPAAARCSSDFQALDPFFRIIEEALAGLTDGEHFFDLLAEDVEFEYIITVPNYPRHVVGRAAAAELYRPYGQALWLNRCFDLAVHHDRETGTVVLEYASDGKVVATGAPYANRYISVLTIENRKVTRWRDYLDPIAVFDALGWP
jgi:uncharacterized protein